MVADSMEIVAPAARLAGRIRVPGDKSISHRYAMLAALATGTSRFEGMSTGADTGATHAAGLRDDRSALADPRVARRNPA